MAILGTQNLLSGRKLGIENRLSEETWALKFGYPLLLYRKTGFTIEYSGYSIISSVFCSDSQISVPSAEVSSDSLFKVDIRFSKRSALQIRSDS